MRRSGVLLLSAFMVLWVTGAHAQTTGTVRGIVTDRNGHTSYDQYPSTRVKHLDSDKVEPLSLSTIAREVTGTSWNGFRWAGLTKRKKHKRDDAGEDG